MRKWALNFASHSSLSLLLPIQLGLRDISWKPAETTRACLNWSGVDRFFSCSVIRLKLESPGPEPRYGPGIQPFLYPVSGQISNLVTFRVSRGRISWQDARFYIIKKGENFKNQDWHSLNSFSNFSRILLGYLALASGFAGYTADR